VDRAESFDLVERLLEAVGDVAHVHPVVAEVPDLTRQVPARERDWAIVEMRATIRKGRVTLAPSDHMLVEGGALAVYARAAISDDVSLADLTYDDEADPAEREVAVEFLANDNRRARSALKDWATATGHARVWFTDEVFEPDPADAPVGPATVTCERCDLEMTDASEDFWKMVRRCGMFPPFCFTCGATVA
jgi:hypothetical protein